MCDCILYDCDIVCEDDCSKCVMFGKVNKNALYKLSYVDGYYEVCCPACKRVKYKVADVKDMIQGNCEHCDKRGEQR